MIRPKEKVFNLACELVVVEFNNDNCPYISERPWPKRNIRSIRRGICKICGSKLYRPLGMQILMHPKTGECPRWEHGQEYEVMGDDRMHYIMGMLQMDDLEPYAYKWRFKK